MDWLFKMLKTSIGQKMLVGLTGLFLCSFLLVHVYINIHLLPIPGFSNDGGAKFSELGSFMAENLIIRIMEVGLFLGFILHIFYSLKLNMENRKAKPVKYDVNAGNKTSDWTSKNMVLLGTTLLIFLILHLWGIYLQHKLFHVPETLFVTTVAVLSDKVYATIYILGVIALALHLKHGFQSAFQTFGIKTPKMTGTINLIGIFFWLVVPVLFASLPLYFGFLGGHN